MPKGHHTKSMKQVRYLMSKGSPLSDSQKAQLAQELHSGQVKVKSNPAPKKKK